MTKRYREIKELVMNGGQMEQALKQLAEINNTYADAIAKAFIAHNIAEALALLNASIKFEIKMELKSINNEVQTIAKANNLVLIAGMDKKKALRLQKKRNHRIKKKMSKTYIKENGLIKPNV